ncbi:hypothetical protein [Elizabethkingia ursingii]
MKLTEQEIKDIIDRGPYSVKEENNIVVVDAKGEWMAIVQNHFQNPKVVAEAIVRVLNSPKFKYELSNIEIRDLI